MKIASLQKKIKRAFLITALIAISFGCKSCMQWEPTEPRNLFGSWYLYKMILNDREEVNYGDIMISFAGTVFNFAYIQRSEIYGAFKYEEGKLILDASYKAGGGFNIPDLYNPFPRAMMFPDWEEIVEVNVTKLTDTNMEWEYIDKYDRKVTAYFKKYP